jgi:hypothetical protein
MYARSGKGDNDGAYSARELLSDRKKPKYMKEEKYEKVKKDATETKRR